MLEMDSPQVRFMLEAVREATALFKQVQSELVSQAITKADLSPVTVADFASQALVGSLLEQNFLHDVLVAEENSAVLQEAGAAGTLAQVVKYVQRWRAEADSSRVCAWIDRGAAVPGSRFWTLDPLDGTKGFLRGDQYVVALALVEDGRVVLATLPTGTTWKVAVVLPGAQQHRRVLGDDVELAVVAHVEEPTGAALVGAEVVVALEGEEEAGTDAPHSHEMPVWRIR